MIPIRMLIVIVSLLITLVGCSSFQYGAPAATQVSVTPKELNEHPIKFDRQRVVVSGFVMLNTNAHILYESRELHEEFTRRLYGESGFNKEKIMAYGIYCVTIGNPRKLWLDAGRYNEKELELSGIYIKDYYSEDSVDLGKCHNDGALIID